MLDWTLEIPQWLWLIAAAVPVLLLLALGSAAQSSGWRRFSVGIVRLLVIVLCAVALARPTREQKQTLERPAKIILLQDESGSVADDHATADSLHQRLIDALG